MLTVGQFMISQGGNHVLGGKTQGLRYIDIDIGIYI